MLLSIDRLPLPPLNVVACNYAKGNCKHRQHKESNSATAVTEYHAIDLPSSVELDGETDPLYDQAVRIVTESRRASVSGIQRRLKIGYNRAARMVETMEQVGLVSPLQSNGTREVLAPAPPEDA